MRRTVVVLVVGLTLLTLTSSGVALSAPAGGWRPGLLVTLPGLGRLDWTCAADGRVGATFTGALPITSESVWVTADGRPLARGWLGERTRRLRSSLGHWRQLVFRVAQITKPASVGATLTVSFRPASNFSECLAPVVSIEIRTHSHAIGSGR